MKRRGFTIVELLVSITVIGILMALLLPAVQKAREASRRAACLNNLRQMGIAFHTYHDSHHQFPPTYVAVRKSKLPQFLGIPGHADDANIHTYSEFLLPNIDQGPMYQKIDFTQPYFSPIDMTPMGLPNYTADNQSVAAVPLAIFRCPSTPRDADAFSFTWEEIPVPVPCRMGANDYGPSCGVMRRGGGILGMAEPQATLIANGILTNNNPSDGIVEARDGLSTTALMWEIAGRPALWIRGKRNFSQQAKGGGWTDIANAENWFGGTSPDGSTVGTCAINCTNQAEGGVYSFHPGGINFLLCDGSARFLTENTSPQVFVNLVTCEGGAPVGEF